MGTGPREARARADGDGDVDCSAAPAPPVPGKSVVVRVVSGKVFISFRAGGRATGPPKGFAPFTGAANIRSGSQLDKSKGRIASDVALETPGV